MPIVRVYSGLPASGKTTEALEFIKNNPGKWKRVNKDSLREMLDGGKYTPKNEKVVLGIRDGLVQTLLEQGYNVIVDDTNLHPKHLARMKEIAALINHRGGYVEVEEKFFDVPLMECIRRDAGRPNSVGAKVIWGMYQQSLMPDPPERNEDLEDAAIVDLDGTLARYIGRSPFDYSKIGQDEVNLDILLLITMLSETHHVLVVSGRPSSVRPETQQWLNDNNIPYDDLFMRAADDNREDSIIKKEIYERDIKDNYNVDYVFDDRDRVVWMWRSLGLRVLQVGYGPF